MSQAYFDKTQKEQPNQQKEKVYESQRSISSLNNLSKWKFNFKKGVLVPDSDIGPQNSKMEIYTIQNFLLKTTLTFFSRKGTLLALVLSILSFVLNSNLYTSLPNYYYIVEFAIIFFLQVILDFYFFFQNGMIENKWKNSKVKKIMSSKKNLIEKIKISNVKIGDLLLIRNSELSPADMLIVASSTIRHGESIFHTNERRIDGQHVFYTKRAVKNMIGSNSSKSVKASQSIPKVVKHLSGHVEYDPPSDLIKFNGIFKLTNDPKVIMFSSKNVLFAGTKLCSSWAIGIVIYNGKNTKIMQKYKNCLGKKQNFSYKENNGDIIFNNSILAIMFICLVEFVIAGIMLVGNSQLLTTLQVVNSTFDTGIYKTFISLFLNFCAPLPSGIFLLIDLISFYNAVVIERKFNSGKVKVKHNELFVTKRASFKKNSTETQKFAPLTPRRSPDVLSKGGFSSKLEDVKIKRNIDIKGKKKGILGSKIGNKPNLALDIPAPSSKVGLSPELNSLQTSRTQLGSKSGKKNPVKKVKITDFRVLNNLGDIEHVVFDKTDTLTKTTIEIRSIASIAKNYTINTHNIHNLYKEVKKNPEKYNTRDEEEDQLKLDAVSNYSEKSQEFGLELKGEFITEVFDEDTPFLNKIKPKHFKPVGRIERKDKSVPMPKSNFLQIPNMRFQRKKEKTVSEVSGTSLESKLTHKKESEFSDLNLAKLEREVLMKFKEMRLGIDRKFKKRLPTMLKSPSFMMQQMGSLDSSDGDGEVLENFDINKKYQTADFLVDFFYKKKQIKELVEALSVCHEARIIEGTKLLKSFNNEEKSVLTLCKKLGISIEAASLPHHTVTEDLNCVYRIKENNKKSRIVKVLGINSFSKKRGRMSVLVQNLEDDFCTLFVKGSDYSMKDIMRLSTGDQIRFKQLIMNYRAKGLKNIVIAKKILKKTDYKAFLINYRLVSKMTRNQQENFEKLALGIEKDLELLGALGIKNNVEPGVERLIDNMQKAEMKISMLTGDNIENSLMAVRHLKLSTNNFNDASSFYSLRFYREKDAVSKVKRIVEFLHQKLKIITINEKRKSTDRDSISSYYNSPLGRRIRSSRRMFTSTSHLIARQRVENEKWEKKRGQLFKPLLINGKSINVIMRTEYLQRHFKFILYFCKNIIGYSLESKHKKFLLKCLKETSKGMIMAVGDGFNDMAMMKEADVGVQVASKDVPLVFGDIVLNDLSILNYLIFVRGKRIYSNLICSKLFFISYIPVMSLYIFLIEAVSCFSTEIRGLWYKIIIGIVIIPIFLMTFSSTKTFSGRLLGEIPEFYLERRSINQNYLPISILAILSSTFDAVIIFTSAYFSYRFYTSEEGYTLTKEVVSVYGFFTFLILGIMKTQAFSLRISKIPLLYGIVSSLILMVYFLLNPNFGKYLMISFPIKRAMKLKEFYFSLSYSLILLGIFNYALGLFINKNFIHPLYFESLYQTSRKHFNFFKRKGLVQPKSFIVKDRKSNLTMFIQKIFKNETKLMDSFVKKIMTLDSSSLIFGLDWLTCNIKDNAENKRYKIYKRTWEAISHRKFISIMWAITFLDLLILFFISDSPLGLFGMESMYVLLFFFLPLIASLLSEQKRLLASYVKMAVILTISIQVFCSFILGYNEYKPFFVPLIRFLQGPAMVEFIFGCVGILMSLVVESGRWAFSSTINGFDFDDSVRIKNIIDLILIGIASIAFKGKIDLMVKMDFLAKLRIKNEVISSNERLRMLMPPFVLKKMKNFEMSQNFLADDAGEVTILFCDICQFNDVMRDCSEMIIQIIDDVFRYFDYLCKQNGIQKIETVGKTYMACGGLKFIEEKLDPELKKLSPTKRTLDLALGMMSYIDKFTYDAGKKLELKIGIHKGNCSYGVLGYHKPQFSLIGDTVNTTSRHCTTGPDSRIILSIQAYDALQKAGEEIDYNFISKMAKMKGKGMKKTYVVVRDIDKKKINNRVAIRPEILENVYNNPYARRKSRFRSQISLQDLDVDKIRRLLDAQDAEEMEEQEKEEPLIEDDIVSGESEENDSGIEQSVFLDEDLDNLMKDSNDSDSRDIGDVSPNLRKNMNRNRKDFNKSMIISNESKKNFKLMDPFGDNRRTFEMYFLRQMMLKNKTKIALCVYILLLEKMTRVTQSLIQNETRDVFWTSEIFKIVICAGILVFIIFSRTLTAIRQPYYSKIFLGCIFLFVTCSRMINIILRAFDPNSVKDVRIYEEQNFDIVYMFILESILVNISGLFYFKDVFLYNIVFGVISIAILIYFNTPTTPHRVFKILETMVFNLTDAHFSFTRELNGINNLVIVEKKGLQLSQFVNRLLPKHVKKFHLIFLKKIHENINKPKKKIGDYYENVTLLYADIVGFTSYSNKHSSRQVVAMLSNLFTDFDKECNRLGLFKIYTIGDCYVVMSFLDKNNRRNPKEEANAVTQMGINMIKIINDVRKRLKIDLNMRIGIHTVKYFLKIFLKGNIFGGVIGTDLVRFDLYGADVVIANKMESKGTPGRINVSESTKNLLESLETCNYSFEYNKQVELDSLDTVVTCYLVNYEYDIDENKEEGSSLGN